MARQTGRRTKVPGVITLGNGRYRIRVRWKEPETGRMLEADRVIENTTFAKAIAAKEELLQELKGGKQKEEEEVTLEAYAIDWLDGVWPTLAPETRKRYSNELVNHILPTFGKLKLKDITVSAVELWRNNLQNTHANSTINGHLRLLRTIMSRAWNEGHIERNPATAVKTLKEDDVRTTLEEPNSLTPEQTRRFLEKAKVLYPQHYAMILTMVTTSIRISAARALRWEDISWTRQMITVCRRLSGEEELRGVKEGADIKIVPMTSALISTLQEHRKRLNPQQLKSGLVFPSEPGGHRSRSVLNTPFKKILKAAGIKQRFTPHGSRRTANNLVRQVASKLITKSITGHCTDRMHELYSTVMDKEKREAAKLAFDELAPIPDSVGDPVGDLSSEYNLDID